MHLTHGVVHARVRVKKLLGKPQRYPLRDAARLARPTT